MKVIKSKLLPVLVFLSVGLVIIIGLLKAFLPANKLEQTEVSQQDCVRAGCSGELCVETEVAGDLFTTCEFKSEYACFQNAICVRLDSGECGFVEDEQFLDCLEQVRSNPADFLIAE